MVAVEEMIGEMMVVVVEAIGETAKVVVITGGGEDKKRPLIHERLHIILTKQEHLPSVASVEKQVWNYYFFKDKDFPCGLPKK